MAKKGSIPWNKGLKGIYSDAVIKSNSKLFSFLIVFILILLSLTISVNAFTWNRPTIIAATLNVNHSETSNSSDFWDDLDDPSDINHALLDNLAWSVAGHTIDTNLDMNDYYIQEIDKTYFSGTDFISSDDNDHLDLHSDNIDLHGNLSTIWNIRLHDSAGDSEHSTLIFGSGRDTWLYYNASDFIIDPDVIGSGDVVILGDIRAENFIGFINSSNVEDIWVNISGDTMTGDLQMLANINSSSNITTTGYVGIGIENPSHNLDIIGDFLLTHVAVGDDEHGLELKIDANGMGDVKGIDLIYETGAIGLGDDEGAILININEFEATGGDVFGVEVLSTEGGANIWGFKVGAVVGAIHQDSGTFVDMDSVSNNGVDNRAEFISTLSDVDIFVGDNDYIIIGDANKFEEIEFILDTDASVNIKPTFEYSDGEGSWGLPFSPIDGTNGFENTGIIAWEDANIPTWATSGGEYLIRITRTKNNIQTNPIENLVQIASIIEYYWDKNGYVFVKNITAEKFYGDWSGGNVDGNLTADWGYFNNLNISINTTSGSFVSDNWCNATTCYTLTEFLEGNKGMLNNTDGGYHGIFSNISTPILTSPTGLINYGATNQNGSGNYTTTGILTSPTVSNHPHQNVNTDQEVEFSEVNSNSANIVLLDVDHISEDSMGHNIVFDNNVNGSEINSTWDNVNATMFNGAWNGSVDYYTKPQVDNNLSNYVKNSSISADNQICIFDGVTGQLLKNSSVKVVGDILEGGDDFGIKRGGDLMIDLSTGGQVLLGIEDVTWIEGGASSGKWLFQGGGIETVSSSSIFNADSGVSVDFTIYPQSGIPAFFMDGGAEGGEGRIDMFKNITFNPDGSVTALDFVDLTPADEKTSEQALDSIISYSDDGNGNINDSALSDFVKTIIPIYEYNKIEECNDRGVCQNITETEIIGYRDARSIGNAVTEIWGGMKELEQQNQDLKNQIQTRDNCWATGKDFIEVKNCISAGVY